jgi:hypothetical protein
MTYQPIGGLVSVVNSSGTPLGGGATFTGAYESCSNFASISINAQADQPGQLFCDFSADGITADRTVTLSNGVDGAFGIHSLIPVNQFYRVRIVNGATPQGSLSLQTLLHTSARIAQPTSRLGQTMTQFSDVLNTRVGNDVILDTARGVIGERIAFQRFGRNPDVGTGAEEDIWYGPGGVGGDYNFLQAASVLRIAAGGNAADDAAGLGAREITITGLDQNWDQVTETLATAGAGVSANTTNQFIRILRVEVTEAGTYGGDNEGDITVETSPGGINLANLQAGKGVTQLAIASVPRNFTAFLTRVRIYIGGTNKTASVAAYCRPRADVVAPPFGPRFLLAQFDEIAGGTEAQFQLQSYVPIPERSDLWFRGIAQTANAAIDVSFDYVLVADAVPI